MNDIHPAVLELIKKLGDDYDVEITFGTRGKDMIVTLACSTNNGAMKRYAVRRILTEVELNSSSFVMEFAITAMCAEMERALPA